jgi:hypothetical protein
MKYYLFIISVIWVCACSNPTANNQLNSNTVISDEKTTLVPIDTLHIKIGEKTNIYSNYMSFKEIKGEPYLGIVNEGNNYLEFYHLTDSAQGFNIYFERKGPENLGVLKGFEILSDSLLIIAGSNRSQIMVSDFNGEIKRVIKTDIARNNNPVVQIYYSQQPLVYNDFKDEIYIFSRVDTDYRKPGLWSGTSFLNVRNSSDEVTHIFNLPEHLANYVHGAYFSHGSHVLAKQRYLILSIPFLKNILILDTQAGEILEKFAGSKYFGDVYSWDNPVDDKHEQFYVESNSYRELIYDKDNELLYRLAYRGLDYVDIDGERRNWDNKVPSIIILNKYFDKIGEFDIPANTFYTRNFFVFNGKLYLSTNHPDNNPSENIMVFVGFKPMAI